MKACSVEIILCIVLTSVIGAFAAGDVDTPPSRPATAKVTESPLDTLRDPFWPIGWTPPKITVTDEGPVVVQPRAPVRWNDARKRLQISGLSRMPDGRYLAILKGIGVVEEADVVAVTLVDFVYKWRITSITEKGFVPEQIGVYPKK